MSPSAAAVAIALSVLCAAAEAVTRHPLVVVLSFDGFRPDYIQPDVTPHMDRLRRESASPPYMRNVFPTKTFVNHMSIATGLYPETHGVLDNYMFDVNNNTMHYTYEHFHYNERVVPIWLQNEYSGDGRHSGVMMWPGSEFKYQNNTPTHVQKYKSGMKWTERVDMIMSWIKDENQPANLVFAYFEEPDKTGHLTGVGSQEIKNQIVRADSTVKYLLDQIKNEHLENKINLIILSDHGMDTVTYDKFIILDNYVSNTTLKVISTGPNAFVLPNVGKFDEVFANLSKAASDTGRFSVYKKEQLPERWHMKNTKRLNGIIYMLAKPGYAFLDEYLESLLNGTTKEKYRIGTHGYDNDEPLMRPMFMASGPLFKKNFTAKPFDNVDLHPLISRVMDLNGPPENLRPNGTIAGVQQLLLASGSDTGAASAVVPPLSPIGRGVLAAVSLYAIAHP